MVARWCLSWRRYSAGESLTGEWTPRAERTRSLFSGTAFNARHGLVPDVSLVLRDVSTHVGRSLRSMERV